ncbi:kinase domain protein (macronuclear) [Tetrahymena thermophila SB210]|uniref:Kinase domain protein n=1 Tax=Tetrahymena thermophila (strain SB210) TaxID=312017 RepID=W7X9R2_TETTS|nr:kinase domain protein [Tetrahymena thermophila SB210]EWS76150.1 kinase domain protein [Tetrahymena thermophila SB210]|eukprot:XP_012651303.1 kinase domain protein [Tetrahymena thermophila SB210]
MSKALQDQLIKTISEKISKDCYIKKASLKEIIKLMFNQKTYFSNFEYLNNGTYALILRAQNTKENRIVALKFLTCSNKEDKNGIESLKKEYEMLQKFSQSDFLVNVYDCFYLMEEDVQQDKDGNEKIILTKEKSYFVLEMELCQQNLKELFDFFRNKQLPSKEIKEIIAIQMLEGLNNLHVKNIMHRDIKPHNFLVQASQTYGFTIKICDLAFASSVTKSKSHYISKKGTDAYFAPEVEIGQSRIQSDLFSLGLVLLELDNLKVLNENWIDFNIKAEIHQGKAIASKYQIDRNSNIYKIAKICLKLNYLERNTSGDLLSELIKLHGKPLKFTLTSMILEEQIPQQAQLIFNNIKKIQKNEQTQFDEQAQMLLDDTDQQIKKKDIYQQFTKVEILSKLLKNLYEDKKYVNNFQILSFGSYGMVLSTKKVNLKNKEIVLKIQKIANEQQIQNEIRIMQQLKTPLVVQLYDNYVIEKVTSPEKYVVFELEKCSCSLQDYLERQAKEGEFSDEEKLNIALQIIDSVNYIHCFNIIHRDIKPDNFLVSLDGNKLQIKLCDFGLSAQLGKNCEQINILDMVGNWIYMAPEILTKNDNENKIYSKKSDSYAVGLLLSLVDNYLILKENLAITFINMAQKKYDEPFKNINIKRDTEIFKFIKLLVVWKRVNRASLSIIVESNSKKFKSNQNDMKQIISQHYLGPIQNFETVNIGPAAPLQTQGQIPIQDIKQKICIQYENPNIRYNQHFKFKRKFE